MSAQKLTVGPDAAGKRVDLFVGEQLKLSRAKLKALFEAEKVRLDGRSGHVRGVDVFHFRDGKIAAKLSYVKG